MGRITRKTLIWGTVGVAVVVGTFAMYWFTPWRLFTTTAVADDLPQIAVSNPAVTASTSSAPAGNQLLEQGSFVSHAHDTTGTVQIVRLADGRRQLVIRDLRTSDGPDLRVWLSDQPVPTKKPYNTYNKHKYLELGKLKGNVGNLVYDIPPGTDLSIYKSIDLWCYRFSVSFGGAELQPA